MQFDKFTVRSQEALQDAQRVASDENQQEISPLHLMLATMGQQEGVALPLLSQCGVSAPGLAGELRSAIGKIPRIQGAMSSPPILGREMRFVLDEDEKGRFTFQKKT